MIDDAYRVAVAPSKHDAAGDLLAALPRALRDSPQASLQQLQQQYQLHAQLLVLFMHAAAQQATGSQQYPVWAFAAATGSARAVHQCQTLEDAIQAVHKKAQASTVQPPQHQQGLTELQLPAAVVQQHQQLQQQLLSELLQLRRSQLDAAPAAGSSSSSSSSSSSRLWRA
jgi:hypothetical protein